MPDRAAAVSDPAPGIRVLAVSDEVDEALAADPSAARTAELILACGDLPFDYLDTLMNALDVPLVFVPGNHDRDVSGFRAARNGLTLRAGLPATPPWPDGAVCADGRVVDVAGLRIAGLGGCRRYGSGPNQYTDRQQARRSLRLRGAARWRRLRDGRGVDVLLTHAPPRGVGDGDDPVHRGFTALPGLVRALTPAVLLHGHVHPYGTRVRPVLLGDTTVYNVTGWHLLNIPPGPSEPKGRPAVWTEEGGGLCRPTREDGGLRRPGGEREGTALFAERRGKAPGKAPGGERGEIEWGKDG
jgi:predicted phosphodiesterase